MELTIIIPVPSGFEIEANNVFQSIMELEDLGYFSSIKHDFIYGKDKHNNLNYLRNLGIKTCDTEWLFLIDAWQMLSKTACIHLELSVSATFGSHGNTLFPMGFFCKTEVAKNSLFQENSISIEPFLNKLPSFTKSDALLIRETK